MSGFVNPGTVNEDRVFVVDFEEVIVTPSGGTPITLGSVHNAMVIASTEYVEHENSEIPRQLDKRVAIRKALEFKGDLAEVSAETMALCMGQDPNSPGVDGGGATRILYHGDRTAEVVFALHATGRYPDGSWVELHIHEAYAAQDEVGLNGGAEVNTIPLHAKARIKSGEDNLGWLRLPSQS